MKIGSSKKVLIITIFAIAAVAASLYAVAAYYFTICLFPGTVIGGIDVSLMTAGEAERAVGEISGIDNISIVERTGEKILDLGAASVRRDYPEPGEILSKQEYYAWPAHLSGTKVYGESYEIVYDDEGLGQVISGYMAESAASAVLPEAAYVDYDEQQDEYVVVPDTEGTSINRAVFRRALQAALKAEDDSLDLEAEGAYYHASVRADDKTLASEAAFLNAIRVRSINIDMGASVTETIEGREILDFLSEERLPDEDRIREFVEELAVTYNTYDTSTARTITTHSGGTRNVTSYYGWQLNQNRTVTAILNAFDAILAAAGGEGTAGDDEDAGTEDIELTASWTHSAASHGWPDYGSTYIEVDMGEQEVYVYSGGKLVIDTPCVTGKYSDAERRTPEGIWTIKYKQTDKTLTGYNPDGSIDYQSFVNYWMPFNGGIGLHDASWRGSFGGDIYLTNGSHGCINLPRAAAKELYNLCYTGMPVICYY